MDWATFLYFKLLGASGVSPLWGSHVKLLRLTSFQGKMQTFQCPPSQARNKDRAQGEMILVIDWDRHEWNWAFVLGLSHRTHRFAFQNHLEVKSGIITVQVKSCFVSSDTIIEVKVSSLLILQEFSCPHPKSSFETWNLEISLHLAGPPTSHHASGTKQGSHAPPLSPMAKTEHRVENVKGLNSLQTQRNPNSTDALRSLSKELYLVDANCSHCLEVTMAWIRKAHYQRERFAKQIIPSAAAWSWNIEMHEPDSDSIHTSRPKQLETNKYDFNTICIIHWFKWIRTPCLRRPSSNPAMPVKSEIACRQSSWPTRMGPILLWLLFFFNWDLHASPHGNICSTKAGLTDPVTLDVQPSGKPPRSKSLNWV